MIRRLIVVMLVIGGCQSLEEMAPPVDESMAEPARSRGADLAALNEGRQIYLTRCSRCHNIEPIDRYSEQKWRRVIPEMSHEARLKVEEQDHLTAYLLTAREMMAGTKIAR